MSKFDYGTFFGGYDNFAVSKEKYTKEQAIELYCVEHSIPKGTKIAVMDAFVRHRIGWNEDNERCCGWWLEYKEHSRSCEDHIYDETRYFLMMNPIAVPDRTKKKQIGGFNPLNQ